MLVWIQSRLDDEVRRRRPPNTNQVLRPHLSLLHGHRPHKFLRFSFHFLDLSSSHCFVTALSQHQGFLLRSPLPLRAHPTAVSTKVRKKFYFVKFFCKSFQMIYTQLLSQFVVISQSGCTCDHVLPANSCAVAHVQVSCQVSRLLLYFPLVAKWGQCGITVLLTQTCYPSF